MPPCPGPGRGSLACLPVCLISGSATWNPQPTQSKGHSRPYCITVWPLAEGYCTGEAQITHGNAPWQICGVLGSLRTSNAREGGETASHNQRWPPEAYPRAMAWFVYSLAAQLVALDVPACFFPATHTGRARIAQEPAPRPVVGGVRGVADRQRWPVVRGSSWRYRC